ncbi:MAG: ABC transporter permease [Lachnospiraceae bacterium]|nr:ABC transporter permease [Lachnospiraceae bacterium]
MGNSVLSYYMFLSLRYIRKNVSRTVYSIMGIMLTVILAFGTLTIGYAMYDYDLASLYDRYGVIQLRGGYFTEAPLQYVDRLKNHELVENVTVVSDVIEAEDGVPTEVMYDVYIGLKDTSNLRASAEKLREDMGVDDIQPYEWIESYMGQGDSTEAAARRAIIALVAALFVAFTMFIIRNTMMLAVLERRKDYGQMRCTGLSAKQLYVLLFTEGVFLSMAGTVLGVSVCFVGLKCVEGWLNRYLQLGGLLTFTCYPSNVAMTTALTVAVTLFALIEPARQAGKATPIEAMHANSENVLSGKRKYKVKKHPIIASLFGVEGEYAGKNISRSPVRMLYLFLGVFACAIMICGVTVFVDCEYATIKKEYRGQNIEFPEIVYTDKCYSEEEFENLEKKISGMDGVLKTGLMLHMDDVFHNIIDPQMQSRKITEITHTAYDKEQIKELSKYLVEGKISYDKMVKEDGVLLCDYTYNVKDAQSDYNYEDRRTTEYKVGDTITEVDPLVYDECYKTYTRLCDESGIDQAIEEYISFHGDSENEERNEAEQQEYEKNQKETEERYKRVMREFLQMVHDAGYPAVETGEGEKITEDSTVYDVFRAMANDCYKRGDTQTYTIQAIISEDIFNSSDHIMAVTDSVVEPYLHLVHAGDSVLPYVRKQSGGFSWSWGIGLLRDVKEASDDLQEFAGDPFDDTKTDYVLFAMGDLYDLAEMNEILHMVQTVGYAIAIFIGLICMIQIYNTVFANLSIREKELRLYRAVGMSRVQERKMILLEHGIVSASAIILAYISAGIASWFIVEKLINQDGSFQYEWNAVKMLVLCGVIFIFTLLAGMGGLHHGRRYNVNG